ncbi:hypothetical protein B7486_44800 [cyanobacterium TDX16]|nr:hypothetical protein B7486_44800 [cyanobacterium TDX16]
MQALRVQVLVCILLWLRRGDMDAIADNHWLRQDEREAWSRRIRQLRQELAQGQAQLSPPEIVSPAQLRRERKSVRINASNGYEQQ